MFEDFAELRPLADVAAAIAERSEWPPLYDIGQLQRNQLPVAAACYFEDMCVHLRALISIRKLALFVALAVYLRSVADLASVNVLDESTISICLR